MPEIATLAASVAAKILERAAAAPRFVVAVAGPPGAGKSTIAEALSMALPEGTAVVVPMDGFHYDDVILARRGLSSRKGAPETFDCAGFKVLLRRIRAHEPDIAIPVFDRSMELSRAGAAIVAAQMRFIIVEGNYLLLDEAPWSGLAPLFDFSIFLHVPRGELERRLLQRWHEHGRPDDQARAWVASNDMPNVDRVLGQRREADLVI